MSDVSYGYQPKVVLVSEYPPPGAGMPVQAQQLLLRLQQQGYPIIPVKTNPQFNRYFSWLENIKIVRGFCKWILFIIQCRHFIKIDVVHIFSASGLNYFIFTIPAIGIGRILGKNIINNYHGGAAKKYYEKYPVVYAWSIRNSNAVIVPSAYLANTFHEFDVKTRIIPNIANVERFKFKKREKFRPIILSARNLAPIYNIDCVIETFRIVYRNHPDAVLYIAGDGPERKRLQELVKGIGLQKSIHFLGNIANHEMPALYEKCDIFLNTPNVDNMPGSILEAYASGLPVVSTNAGGIPFVVTDGKDGLLANIGDSKLLAEHIMNIVSNPEIGKILTGNAMQRLEAWNPDHVVKEWIAEYHNIYTNVPD